MRYLRNDIYTALKYNFNYFTYGITMTEEKEAMGLLGSIIAKGIVTAATNSTIKAVGDAVGNVAESVIVAKASNPTEQNIIMVKNEVTLIKPTRTSEDYCGENAMDIVRELIGAGFENVMLKPVHNLNEKSKKRYGEIESISINGKEDFLGIKKNEYKWQL